MQSTNGAYIGCAKGKIIVEREMIEIIKREIESSLIFNYLISLQRCNAHIIVLDIRKFLINLVMFIVMYRIVISSKIIIIGV